MSKGTDDHLYKCNNLHSYKCTKLQMYKVTKLHCYICGRHSGIVTVAWRKSVPLLGVPGGAYSFKSFLFSIRSAKYAPI